MIDFRDLINRYKDGETKIVRYLVMAGIILGAVVIALVIFSSLPGTSSTTPTQVTASTEFLVRSIAFNDGEEMWEDHTGDGEDRSPPLDFLNVPAGAVELALICIDPNPRLPETDSNVSESDDGSPWTHWVIYKIPADAGGLAEGIDPGGRPNYPVGAMQGLHSWGELETQDEKDEAKERRNGRAGNGAAANRGGEWRGWDASSMGYRGPMPSEGSGRHRYMFTLYVLGEKLEDVAPGLTRDKLLAAMQGKIIAQTEFVGTYKR